MKTLRADTRVTSIVVVGLVGATAGGFALASALVTGSVEMPVFAVLWFIALAISWYVALTTATEVVLDHEGSVTCRAVLRIQRFAAADVTAIRAWVFLNPYGVTIVHRHGTARIVGRMDGFSDLVAELKQANPSLEQRGV